MIDAGDALDQRRLARPVVAEQPDDLAGTDVPADIVDGGEAPKALGQVADREDRLHYEPSLTRPVIRSRDWSMSTARMITVPTTMNCQNASTLSSTRPVVSPAMMSEPMIVPTTEPDPPNRLTPPMITA